MLAFTVAVTLAAAMFFGVLPAWQSHHRAGDPLKEHSRSATGAIGRMRWGRFLVSLQLALSLPLLVGAGLLVRTLYNLQRIDLGYPAERLLLVGSIPARAGTTVRRDALFRELLEQSSGSPA